MDNTQTSPKRRGPKLTGTAKRVIISARVSPETAAKLLELATQAGNMGRALDRLLTPQLSPKPGFEGMIEKIMENRIFREGRTRAEKIKSAYDGLVEAQARHFGCCIECARLQLEKAGSGVDRYEPGEEYWQRLLAVRLLPCGHPPL